MATNYKLIKTIERKYYKHVDSPWTQPVFTSNTTWGTVSADSYSSGSGQVPWHALDGYTSGGDGQDFASSGSSTVNWYWDFAYPLKISIIQMWNRANAGSYGGAETYTIYGKNSDNSYEQIGTISLAAVGWESGSTNISSAKEYYGLKINCVGTRSYAGIGEILLTATHETIEPGTAQDYDYYEDVDVYKAIKAIAGRNYYKYKEVAAGYRELEYLTNALFDTGVQCTTQTSFEYEAAKTDNENWKYALMNVYNSQSEWFISGYENGYLEMHYKARIYNSNINPVIDKYYKIYGDFSTNTKRYYVNDVQQFTISDNSSGNLGGSIHYSGTGWRCKTLKLYDSSLNVIGEFHPCERMSDNTVGWYDVVSDTFITPGVTPSEVGDYATEPGTAQDYDFYENVYAYKAIEKQIVS